MVCVVTREFRLDAEKDILSYQVVFLFALSELSGFAAHMPESCTMCNNCHCI